MELIIKNADFSACGIGQTISNDVIRMMAKYSNFADNDDALQAMQAFYSTVGSDILAKCTIIVPCFAANVTEAMKDLVTDTDLRSNTFDGNYFNITANKGLVATNEASSTTANYRKINAMNGGSDKYNGQLKMLLYSNDSTTVLCQASDGGYIYPNNIFVNANAQTALSGMTNEGLTISSGGIRGFNTNGIIGILDNQANGSKYSIIDDENVYSTIRTAEETQSNPYNSIYMCQYWNSAPNTSNPIAMFVWGIGISDAEAIILRNAVKQFKIDMGI